MTAENQSPGHAPARASRRPAVILGLLAVVAGACSSNGPQRPSETLRVGVITATDNLPYYVMVARGFAAHQGLRVEETPIAGGTAALAAMVAGTIDVGQVGVVSLAAGADGGTVPSAAVGVLAGGFVSPEHPLLGVLARADVRSWADLAGRKVAVNSKVSLGAAGLAGRLKAEGAAPAELVEVPFTNMGLGVRSGDLAAAVAAEPYVTQSELRGDGHLLGWVVGGPPMERVEASILAARVEVVATRPGAIKAYIRAYREAVGWIASHDTAAREILASRLVLPPDLARQVRLPAFSRDGRNDPAQVQAALDVLPSPRPAAVARQLYDERLLDAVLAER